MKFTTKQLTTMGIMAALSVILVYMIHVPLFPAAPYLEYDPADIPILISTFVFGPTSGFILTIVVSAVQGMTVSAQSGIIGILMHIFATGSFVLVAGNIYRLNRKRKTSVLALAAGAITMTAVMCLWNLILTPVFTGFPVEVVIEMLVPIIIPFNLIKAGINSAITFIAYKKVGEYLHANAIK